MDSFAEFQNCDLDFGLLKCGILNLVDDNFSGINACFGVDL